MGRVFKVTGRGGILTTNDISLVMREVKRRLDNRTPYYVDDGSNRLYLFPLWRRVETVIETFLYEGECEIQPIGRNQEKIYIRWWPE